MKYAIMLRKNNKWSYLKSWTAMGPLIKIFDSPSFAKAYADKANFNNYRIMPF